MKTIEQLRERKQKLLTMIESIENPELKEKVLNMFKTLGERFVEAPASGFTKYHGAYPGGLLFHTEKVLENLRLIAKTFNLEATNDEITVSALLHDLGKIGDTQEPYYVPETSDWHRKTLGKMYNHNENLFFLTVPDRSLYLCMEYGIPLNKKMFQAIKTHDGFFVEENSPYKQKQCELALFLHMADIIACTRERD